MYVSKIVTSRNQYFGRNWSLQDLPLPLMQAAGRKSGCLLTVNHCLFFQFWQMAPPIIYSKLFILQGCMYGKMLS